MNRPKEPEQAEVILTVRLPAGARDALRADAEASHRTLSGQVRWLIDQSLHRGDATPLHASDDLDRKAA